MSLLSSDPKLLNSSAPSNMCLIILILYALKELCMDTMQHSEKQNLNLLHLSFLLLGFLPGSEL